MKIALVHDYIKEYGGAERVLEALHEIWPDAPVFTTVYLPEFLGPHKERFNSPDGEWDIRTSFLQYIPFKEKLISPFRLIASFVFKRFDFSKFDVVIVSATGAYIPNTIKIRNPKSEIRNKSQNTKYKIQNTIHVCYSHTPPRYLYGYATAREWKNNILFRVLGEIANHFLRLVDFKSSQNVDYFIANSKNVAARIEKFYRREATVIYPPVEVDGRRWKIEDSNLKMEDRRSIDPQASTLKNLHSTIYHLSSKKSYFLAGGRLARPKHIDLIAEACQKLKLPLKVFGRVFADAVNISVSQYPNIQFLGEVSDEEKLELMKNAKAYIFAAEDEDFGITPVEAMSVGTPVIAYKSGGVVESIIDGKTGIFYRFNDLNHLSEAVNKFEKMKFDKETIMKHAQKFSKERFKKEIKDFITKKFKQ